MAAEFHRRVLIAEDEEFTLNLLSELLSDADFEVMAVATVSEAISQIESFDPHAVITDLNFGVIGPSGADLLDYLDKNHPWIGKVILTSHASPNLAVPGGMQLPDDVTYLVLERARRTKISLARLSRLIITESNTYSPLV